MTETHGQWDVFLSHSSKDGALAEELCRRLEEAGISVWMAPRNITPGRTYAAEIIRGVEQARVFVLVLTANSRDSAPVRREAERAASLGTPMVPMMFEDLLLDDEWKFYISSSHWLNATKSNLDASALQLIESVRALRSGGRWGRKRPAGGSGLPMSIARAAVGLVALGVSLLALRGCLWTAPTPAGPEPPSKEHSQPTGNDAAPSTPPSGAKVRYETKETEQVGFTHHRKLIGRVDGDPYAIDAAGEFCMEVFAQKDFDGDGTTDALIQDSTACGGNATGYEYFFVSYQGSGFFKVTERFGFGSWSEPVIEPWKGKLSVVVVNHSEGFGNHESLTIRERWVLREGRAALVESARKSKMAPLVELKSDAFGTDPEPDETRKLSYDLDGDGKNDEIRCNYRLRWGSMQCDVEIGQGTATRLPFACKRIGVLESSELGVKNLVCNEDSMLVWNGTSYALRKDGSE